MICPYCLTSLICPCESCVASRINRGYKPVPNERPWGYAELINSITNELVGTAPQCPECGKCDPNGDWQSLDYSLFVKDFRLAKKLIAELSKYGEVKMKVE